VKGAIGTPRCRSLHHSRIDWLDRPPSQVVLSLGSKELLPAWLRLQRK
jgi:hypothetical protein